MSDEGRTARHENTARSEADIRDRLIRLEINSETTVREAGVFTTELKEVRKRVHEMADAQGALVLMAEEAKDSRDELVRKVDKLTDTIAPTLVNHSQLATTVAMHMQQCIVDKERQNEAIQELTITVGTINKTIWKAIGAISGVGALLTVLSQLWKHILP